MSSALDTILAKLPDYRQHGASYRAPCPGHDSENPTTLHITPIGETVLLYCHARGCSPDTILAALGLRWAELYADSDRRQNGTRATGQRTRQAKRKLTREADAISATLAAEQLDGLAYGPEPDYPSELELMAPYTGLVEHAWDVFSDGGHQAVQDWLSRVWPELQRAAPGLAQALDTARRRRHGGSSLPRVEKARDLLGETFPEPQAIVEDVLLEGVILIIGFPEESEKFCTLDDFHLLP